MGDAGSPRAMNSVVRFKNLAPYAVMALVLPGGSLIAPLLWLYRRRNQGRLFVTDEILAFL